MEFANPPQLIQQDSTAATAALVLRSGTKSAVRIGRKRTLAMRVPSMPRFGAKSQELARSLFLSNIFVEIRSYCSRTPSV